MSFEIIILGLDLGLNLFWVIRVLFRSNLLLFDLVLFYFYYNRVILGVLVEGFVINGLDFLIVYFGN